MDQHVLIAALVFLPGWVTAHAVIEISNTFFAVLGIDFSGGVFVAAEARISAQTLFMAGSARTRPSFPVVDRKSMRFLKLRWRPGCGGVAGGAVRREKPAVKIWIGMAGDALLGCAFEYIVRMAAGAFHVDMRPGQRKGRQRVIKTCLFPILRCMAASAILPELPLVNIILDVAGGALVRCALEHTVNVAAFTRHIHMRPAQCKSRQ